MGCWDTMCVICGCPAGSNNLPYGGENNILQGSAIQEFKDDTKWLVNCTILTPDGEKYHNSIEVVGNIEFKTSKGIISSEKRGSQTEEVLRENAPAFGIFLHTDCWEYIKRKTGYEISYANIPSILLDKYGHALDKIKYGGIEKYWDQDFAFDDTIEDGNQWMYKSPLLNKKNQTRIIKVLAQLELTGSELKKRMTRPSPPISAKFVPDKTYAVGNDGNIWQRNRGKWVAIDTIPKKIVINTTSRNGLNNLFFKQQISVNKQKVISRPFFIVSRNKNVFELIGVKESKIIGGSDQTWKFSVWIIILIVLLLLILYNKLIAITRTQ